MDPAEAVFATLLRMWKRVRPTRTVLPEGAAPLEPQIARLEVLGAMLMGERPTIQIADDGGGLLGTTILLPRFASLLGTPSGNMDFLMMRVAVAASMRALELDRAARDETMFDTVATLLSVPAVLRHMFEELPNTRAIVADAARAESGHVGEAGRKRRPPHPVELLRRERLARTAGQAGNLESDPPMVSQWVRAALALDPTTPEELASATTQLLAELPRVDRASTAFRSETLTFGRMWRRPVARVETEEGETPDPERAGERAVLDLDRTIRLTRKKIGKREDKPLFHIFEKLETAEDFAGQSATPDGSGDASEMKDAISELALGTAIRTDEVPENLVRADVIVDPGGVEVATRSEPVSARTIKYREWNDDKGAFRDDWVTLTEERLFPEDGGAANRGVAQQIVRRRRRQVEDIRGLLLRALHDQRVRNRQTDGPDFDIGALVDRHADLAAGRTPSERLYMGPRRSLREVAILILLDTSYSTDAWLGGRRVLDVEVESLLVLAEALEGVVEEEIAVASFNSHTRNSVRFGVLKDFDDDWSTLRAAAPGLVPAGYTRIGAALRHATAMMDRAGAREKLLLFVSDGKPIDYDRYEGRYGIADVAMAVREAKARHVKVFGLAIEKEAKRHLAQMLGAGNYRVLPRTDDLPDVMAEVFVRLIAG